MSWLRLNEPLHDPMRLSEPRIFVAKEYEREVESVVNDFLARPDIRPLGFSAAMPVIERLSEHDPGGVMHSVTVAFQLRLDPNLGGES